MRYINFFIKTIIMIIILNIFPITVSNAEGEHDLNFTDATSNESGDGWTWNNSSKVLTLSGANFNEGIILPSNSSIKVINNSINNIDTSDTVPITTSGELTIKGTGTLSLITKVDDKGVGNNTLSGVTNLYVEDITLNTEGVTGLAAENITIKNSKLNIWGYRHGIYSNSSEQNKDLLVKLINSTGQIKGELLQGIEMINTASGNVELNIEKCNNLTITGNLTNKKLSGVFERSGARLYTFGPKSNATVTIKESKNVNFYGTNTGIAIDCHSDDPSILKDNGKASLIIEDSTVVAETVTKTWAAFFVNNNGIGVDASANINIKNSNVSALAPNDVAIMTSTKNTTSSVTVNNSVLQLAGVYAGIRAKSNTSPDAEIFVIENSLIVVVDKTNSNYKALDEMDNAISSDGSSGIDQNSKVISPKDCVIVMKENGIWEVPDEGTILINGEEKKFIYGGVIKESGEVLPYITSLNDAEFTNLNEALSVAKPGDNVVFLIADSEEKAVLPLGVTLTSPIHLSVKTNEYGYKVVEEIVDGNYVYKVVPLEKYKVTYHFNYGEDTVIIKEVFEQSNLKFENDIFIAPEGMEFDHWYIGEQKYYSGDTYHITKDIDVYAKWKIKEKSPILNEKNPETSDNIGISIMAATVSLIGIISIFVYLSKNKNKV